MQITLITVGRCRDRALNEIADRYATRIGHYASLTVQAVKEEPGGSRSPAQVVTAEGRRLLDGCPENGLIAALDPSGDRLGSEAFSARIGEMGLRGNSRITFLIGGAIGLSDEVLERADWTLSLSAMTLPHDLARIVLLEQVYRAFTILRGESYHK